MNQHSSNNTQLTNPNEETTMQCDKVWDLLSVYADGEASAEEAGIVESHVAACAGCAADLEFMQSTSAAVQSAPEVEPPAMLREAILAATVGRVTVAERLASVVRRTLNPAPVRYGALAAGAAALAVLMLQDDPSLAPNPAAYRPATAGSVAATVPTNPAVAGIAALPIPDAADATLGAQSERRVRARVRQTERKVRAPLMAARRPAQTKPSTIAARSAGSPTLVARNLVNHRAKVTSAGRPAADLAAEDMGGPTFSEPIEPSTPEPATTTLVSASGNSAVEDGPRFQLVASSAPVSGGQATTMADLKRALNRQAPGFAANDLRRTIRDREIHVDVLRSTF